MKLLKILLVLSHKITFKNKNLGNREKEEKNHWLPTKTAKQNIYHSFFAFLPGSSRQNC